MNDSAQLGVNVRNWHMVSISHLGRPSLLTRPRGLGENSLGKNGSFW